MPQTLSFDFILTPDGVRENARLLVDDSGFISAIEDAGKESRAGYFALPGMPNAHSHCFQRALAGFGERNLGADSFWDWREHMYRLANRVTPEAMYIIARQTYSEMLAAGFTAVGEFHYLHHLPDGSPSQDMSDAVLRAAADVGIRLVMLPVLYLRGGFNAPLQPSQKRFGHDNLDTYLRMVEALGDIPKGLAPHSLRAVPVEFLPELVQAGRELLGLGFPLHIHISEQQREVQECIAHSGSSPIDALAQAVELDSNWNLVHATHASQTELGRIATAGARVVICPLTEAYLGDGIFPATDFVALGGELAIGSDSDVRIDAVEELRMLEYSQRLQQQLRARLSTAEGLGGGLWSSTAQAGARALAMNSGKLAVDCMADLVVLNAKAPPLQGPRGQRALDALITAGSRENIADVYVGGRLRVNRGQQEGQDLLGRQFAKVVRGLLDD
ncbi:MAG: formimidoylglutamate deiminase [Gammaproteobacteria bacterium]|nr:formimidoylglutamate deiminase [Gammaproteobacteria bacterium]